MNSAPKPYKRSNLFINPTFQTKFLFFTVGAAGITLVIFYLAKLMFFAQLQIYLISLGLPPDHMIYDFISKQSQSMDMILLIAGVIEVLVLTLIGLVVSHRIAGPMYRLHQDLLEMAKTKQPRPIRFRTKDYFQEIPTAFNEFIKNLK